MLLSEYLRLRNQHPGITTGNVRSEQGLIESNIQETSYQNGKTFAETLNEQIAQKSTVEFSGHALKRISSRNIDVLENDKLDRLNKGVEIAAGKGSQDALVLVDSTAFIVSVKNNTVVTTLSGEDLMGSVFTNIDSTVIM